MVASPSGTFLFGIRLMADSGRLSVEQPLLLSVLKVSEPGLLLSLEYSLLFIKDTLILTLVAFGGIGYLASHIRYPHCHNINLQLLYLASSGLYITCDLGVFSPCVDITVAGCHWVLSATIKIAQGQLDCILCH